jgi:hypothetical protein
MAPIGARLDHLQLLSAQPDRLACMPATDLARGADARDALVARTWPREAHASVPETL